MRLILSISRDGSDPYLRVRVPLVAPHQSSPLGAHGVHTSETAEREGDYFGPAVNKAARLMAIAHGGQVVVSAATEHLVRGSPPDGVGLIDLGEHRLRDLSEPIRVFQVRHGSLPATFPQLRSLEHYLGKLPLQHSSHIDEYLATLPPEST